MKQDVMEAVREEDTFAEHLDLVGIDGLGTGGW